MRKKFSFGGDELERFDMTRRYDGDPSAPEGIPFSSFILLYAIGASFAIFVAWACFAEIDEIARGEGRVVPTSEVQAVQTLEGGIVDEMLVKEGDVVRTGQTVARMRDVQARSDYQSLRQQYLALSASVARLTAEAEGGELAFPPAVTADAPDSVAAERAALEAVRRQNGEQAGILRAQQTQRRQEVEELKSRIANLEKIMKLAREERDMVAPMVEKGAAAKQELLRIDRELTERDAELNAARLSLPRLEAGEKEAQRRLDELDSGFRAAARRELTQKTAEMAAIEKSLDGYSDRVVRADVKSPVTGKIKEIKVKTAGGVVRPGDPLMDIVPIEDRLIIEGHIKPADIAFIYPGQKAVVRLSAFDFSVFGAFEGRVDDISPDSLKGERGESFYRVRIGIEKSSLKKGAESYPVLPGMQATVDIVTGKKTVMRYLLKPLIKASHTALRER